MKVIPVRPTIYFSLLPIFIFCFLFLSYVPHNFAGLPSQGKQAWSLMEGPSQKYEDSSQEGDLFALMNRAEIIFTGKIQSIRQPTNPGLMPIPLTFMTFNQIEEFKGRLPMVKNFRYPYPLKTLQFSEGAEVIVLLRRYDTQNYEIVKLIRMTKANLSLAKSLSGKLKTSGIPTPSVSVSKSK
jgi:hypothetical protein